MLELALLGLLKERPMHGYELRKRLREEPGPLANLSFGSLYPALARLEAAGAVRAAALPARWHPGEAPEVPLTGSLGGERAALVARRATAKAAAALGGRGTRARKVYEITDRGEGLFEQLLESGTSTGGEEGKDFSLKLAFARHLSPPARVRLLERRLLQLADRLQQAERAARAPGRRLDEYELALAEHARDTLASDLAWVERLLARERELPGREPPGGELPEHPRPASDRRARPGAAGRHQTEVSTAGTRAGRNEA